MTKIIKNGVSYEKNGWKYVSVKGGPRERGYAYGYFCAEEFKKIQEMLKFTCYNDIGETWEFFIDASKKYFEEKIKNHFPEFYEEIEGIAEGCNAGGTKTNVHEILAWNNSFTLLDSWYSTQVSSNRNGKEGGSTDHCSAFIAVGDYTEDGKIVVAHNSFANFIDGQYMRVILDIKPSKGHRILMQTCACWIWSGTDFFVTSKGIIGTETTIGGFIPYENNFPIAFCIRKAMQYGNTLDDYVKILLDGNSGDYANSWLFGDTNTNEILRIELGLKYYSVDRTKNGYFVGFNATYDPMIRNKECNNSGFLDTRRHQGARRVRLTDLMEENKGKLNVELALKLIADHYDVYLEKENMCSRTVCGHYELDTREYMCEPGRPKPYQPRGAIDGCVVDTNMAKNMSFIARYGNSCGTPFIVKEFCDKRRQWAFLKNYLHDRPSQPWTLFTVTNNKNSKQNKTIKKNTGNSKTRKNTKEVEQKGGEIGNSDGDECAFCYERSADTVVFDCINNKYHYWCKECIFDWISKNISNRGNVSCPLCKGELNTEKFENVCDAIEREASNNVVVLPSFEEVMENALNGDQEAMIRFDSIIREMREERNRETLTMVGMGTISLMIVCPFISNAFVPTTVIIITAIFCYRKINEHNDVPFIQNGGNEKMPLNQIKIKINGAYDKNKIYKLLQQTESKIDFNSGILLLETNITNTKENVENLKQQLK